MPRALASATWAFLKHYFVKRGLLDGWAGFVIALAYFRADLLPLCQTLRAGPGLAGAFSGPYVAS